MQRLKSKFLWVAILAQVTILLNAYGVGQIITQDINTTVNVILNVLVILGILNNPTDKEKF